MLVEGYDGSDIIAPSAFNMANLQHKTSLRPGVLLILLAYFLVDLQTEPVSHTSSFPDNPPFLSRRLITFLGRVNSASTQHTYFYSV